MINKPREEAGQFYTANKAGQPASSLGKINRFISEKITYLKKLAKVCNFCTDFPPCLQFRLYFAANLLRKKVENVQLCKQDKMNLQN